MSRDELEAKLNELLHEADEQRRTADELESDAHEMAEHATAHRYYSWELLGRAAQIREQIDTLKVKRDPRVKMVINSMYGRYPNVPMHEDELLNLLNKLFQSMNGDFESVTGDGSHE